MGASFGIKYMPKLITKEGPLHVPACEPCVQNSAYSVCSQSKYTLNFIFDKLDMEHIKLFFYLVTTNLPF